MTDDEELQQIMGYADTLMAAREMPGAQRSTEWLMQRLGHCTASRFKDVLDITAKGKEGAKRKLYRLEIIGERLTGAPAQHWVSKPMEDGLEREPAAKMAYAARTGTLLMDCGFTHHKTLQWIGGSPDSLISNEGGVEFKCPGRNKHIETLQSGMPEEHAAQVQGLMWIFDCQWWDFCSYQPEFSNSLNLYIERIERNEVFIDNLRAQIAGFLSEIQEQCDTLLERT